MFEIEQRLIEKWNPLLRAGPGGRNSMRAHGFRNRLTDTVKGAWILASVFTTLTQVFAICSTCII